MLLLSFAVYQWIEGDATRTIAFRAENMAAAHIAAHSARLTRIEEAGEKQIKELPDKILKRVDGRIDDALKKVDGQVSTLNTTVRDGIKDIRTDTKEVVNGAVGKLDTRLGEFNKLTGDNLQQANTSLNKIAELSGPLKVSADAFASAMPLWFECDHNPDCLPNRGQGFLKSGETMAIDISKWIHVKTKPRSKKAAIGQTLLDIGFLGARLAR